MAITDNNWQEGETILRLYVKHHFVGKGGRLERGEKILAYGIFLSLEKSKDGDATIKVDRGTEVKIYLLKPLVRCERIEITRIKGVIDALAFCFGFEPLNTIAYSNNLSLPKMVAVLNSLLDVGREFGYVV